MLGVDVGVGVKLGSIGFKVTLGVILGVGSRKALMPPPEVDAKRELFTASLADG
jgi:hypothetical protein